MGQHKYPRIPGTGATGRFPSGKLNKEDEGELRMATTIDGDTFILNFGKPVVWIGLKSIQAQELGEKLLEFAKRQAS